MNKIIIALIIYILINPGCLPKNKRNLNHTEKSFDTDTIKINGLEKIKEIPPSLFRMQRSEITNDQLDLFVKKISVKSIIDSCQYIKLETSPKIGIGSISKIIIKNEQIYILDIRNTKTLFVFNIDGSFSHKISRVGQGPGEYFKPSDFFIGDDGHIEIFDKNMRKIIYYDKSGKYIKEKAFEYWTKSCQLLDDSKYVFYTGFRYNQSISQDSLYNIIFTNSNFKIQSKQFPYPKTMKNLGYGASLVFTKYGNNLLFKPTLDNHIYKLGENGKFFPKYFIDFGNFIIPQKTIIHASFENRQSAIKNFNDKKYARDIRNVFETEKYLSFIFTFKGKIFITYFNKITKTLIYGNIIIEKELGIFAAPQGVYKNRFIYTIEPYYILQNPNSNELSQKIKTLNTVLFKVLKEWDINSNPIIVIASLK